jgi:hypothetical protein
MPRQVIMAEPAIGRSLVPPRQPLTPDLRLQVEGSRRRGPASDLKQRINDRISGDNDWMGP